MTSITPTEEQKAIIKFPKNLVVIAKPGSGKTYVLSEKISTLLPQIPEYKGIIAISYTNKASDELAKRTRHKVAETKKSFFGTIDNFCCTEIVFPFLPQLWGKPLNEIIIKKIEDLTENEIFSKFSKKSPNTDWFVAHLHHLKSFFESGLVILETISLLALYILNHSIACERYIKARYTHVFIDEYQDSELEQHNLFLKLEELGLIAIAVGDIDQSIFEFSGKNSKYLTELADNDNFKTLPLSFNHRCHPSIINYSYRLLDKDSVLLNTDTNRVIAKSCTGTQEVIAYWIDSTIPKILTKLKLEKYSDIAVLVRGNLSGELINNFLKIKHRYFVSHPLENSSEAWSKLFYLLFSFKFNSKITAKEIVTSTNVSLNKNDEINLINKIKKIRFTEVKNLCDLFIGIASVLLPNYKSDSAIEVLKNSMNETLPLYFEPPKNDEVQIMTIHKSKGLEFDVVFHLDLYEWVFPSKIPGENGDFNNPIYQSLQQDTNLHYVAITRARKVCFLCTSTQRIHKDWKTGEIKTKNAKPSEFLNYNNLSSLRRNV